MFDSKENQNTEIKVSVIIPVLNEEKYIEKCIESVIKQDYKKEYMELLLIDGCSDDNTVKIINSYIEKYNFIKLLKNEKRTVQCALNIGIQNSIGLYIVRMDAHSEYANDYISKCIEYLEKTGADNVGGPMIAKGKTKIQNVVAAAYHSPFALGGGKFHEENYEGYADTVYLGAFKRQTLIDIGMYDEMLPRSEDDDLNFRINENKGKIYITPEIKSVYYPRSSYMDVFKQYFEYGLWKVAVIKKHKKPARISHLIPLSFVLFIVTFLILSMFSKFAMSVFVSVMMLYLGLDIYFSFKNAHLKLFSDKLRLAWVHIILHISYGIGFFCGIFKFLKVKF